jgi:hypothetical protein
MTSKELKWICFKLRWKMRLFHRKRLSQSFVLHLCFNINCLYLNYGTYKSSVKLYKNPVKSGFSGELIHMPNMIQVTAAQLLIALIGAAGIGALVSSVTTLIAQILERRHRRREIILQLSSDFAKLLFEHPDNTLGFAQLSLVGQYYVILDEVFKHRKNSPEMGKELHRVFDAFLDKTRK